MARPHPNNHPLIKAGSRWWRVDFHTHTGHSTDAYQEGDYSDRKWLLEHMRKEIDAVCVTDHNGGRQIDLLKAEYEKMHGEYLLSSEEAEEDFREITIYPGAELTTSLGFHCLVILDPSKGSADISRILGDLEGEEGSPNSKWNNTPRNFRSSIDHILIPAHVDGAKGLFRDKILRSDPTLEEAGEVALRLDADERKKTVQMLEPKVLERSRRSATDPELDGYEGAFVYGSDSHQYSEIGLRSTWIRMEEATLDALKIALADNLGSVRECVSDNEPQGPDKWVSRITIKNTSHMGLMPLPNGELGEPFTLDLNPGLNAIIGGRGSGKSTILEILRKVTFRSSDLDSLESNELRAQHDSLLADSMEVEGRDPEVSAEFRYYSTLSRIDYTANSDSYELEEENAEGELEKVEFDAEELPSKLPFRIYSQKQLYRFRKDTSLLLKEVDQTLDVGASAIYRRLNDIHANSLSLRGEVVALNNLLKSKKSTEVELAGIKKRIALLKDSENSKILTEYSLRSRQGSQINEWLSHLKDIRRELEDCISAIELKPLVIQKNTSEGGTDEKLKVEEYSSKAYEAYRKTIDEIKLKIDSLNAIDRAWDEAHRDGEWQELEEKARSEYEELSKKLTEEGQEATDPKLYKSLIEKRDALELELSKLQRIEKNRNEKFEAYKTINEDYFAVREELSEKREEFLRQTFDSRDDLKLAIKRFGDKNQAIASLRELLHRHDSSYEEFNAIGDALFPTNGPPDLANIKKLKEDLRSIKKHEDKHTSEKLGLSFGKRFVDHVRGLTSEDFGRLELWYPDDKLNVKIQKSDRTGSFVNLDKASPGQVATAVLAFLLAYGDQPLILDQPEDDLDNKMIFSIIVTDLIKNKSKRQVIIVTHNANLVVNANADLIYPLESENGLTTAPHFGALQKKEVRDSVCTIMEGGRQALEQRFKRMTTGEVS